jgi:tRNA(Arg) A34 adenosine deaminase TadA
MFPQGGKPSQRRRNERFFLQRAILLAHENKTGPFGAVIVRDNKIIAEGRDQVHSTCDPTAHAEIMALRNACVALNRTDLSGCDIFTNCEPCPMCLGAIYWAKLRTIYYCSTRADAADIGFDDELIYNEMALQPERRKIPAVRLADEASNLVFSEWGKRARKGELLPRRWPLFRQQG